MGRRGTSEKLKGSVKTKNKHNLSPERVQLRDNVDILLKLSTSVNTPLTNITKVLENQKELNDIIDKIRNLESKITKVSESTVRNTPDKIGAFSDWLRKNGAVFEGCSIGEFEGCGLGLKAEVDVPFGSTFVSVPKKLMMTVESARKTILKNLIENDHILKNMPNVALAIYLLVEKFKENSFYKPYIDILPRSYSTVLYFSLMELEELRGSPTLEVALRQIKSIARQYAYFHTIFSNGDDAVSRILRPHFTFDEYRWAVSTVMTRQNTIPSDEENAKMTALIPLWDFCNHENGKISTDYNPELERSECLAHRDFKAGEQLFIFYGPRNNAEFFIHNGFIPEENDYDMYTLKLGVSKSDPLQENRHKLLQKLSLANTQEFQLKPNAEFLDGKLLAFVRIFNMNEEQLSHWLESDKVADLEYMECALDVSLEKKSWVFLQTRLKLLLATYKTALDEDISLLNENKLSPNALLAVKMRVSEKKIIRDVLQLLEQHIQQ